MTCFLVATITDARHQVLALETPADSIIDTFWFTPVALQNICDICIYFLHNLIVRSNATPKDQSLSENSINS